MRIKSTLLCSLVASIGLVNISVAAESVASASASAPAAMSAPAPVKVMTGQDLAFDKNKGNCLSCHVIHDPKATAPGNLGPELVALKDRYTRDTLRAQIWDATKANPNTAMPPMGRNKILTEEEIDKVVDYLLSL